MASQQFPVSSRGKPKIFPDRYTATTLTATGKASKQPANCGGLQMPDMVTIIITPLSHAIIEQKNELSKCTIILGSEPSPERARQGSVSHPTSSVTQYYLVFLQTYQSLDP
jgi:hypothetical protein